MSGHVRWFFAGLFALFALLVIAVLVQSAMGQEPSLEQALVRTVSVNEGRHPIAHCRAGSAGWARCVERIGAFAAAFRASGEVHGIDPWLLAAIAVRESGLNPQARGPAGELGIMQLHPRGVGRGMEPRLARRQCASPEACQLEVVDRAARELAACLARCGGEAEALGCYNSGRCERTEYSERVLRRRAELLRSEVEATTRADG